MLGCLVLQSVAILWLVHAVRTGGAGASNGRGPIPNGKPPQDGGAFRRLFVPSKGVGQAVGAQTAYGGYPTKGAGYGAAAGGSSGGWTKAYGTGAANGRGGKAQGYGVQMGPTNGQRMKGYGAQLGGYSRQGNKGGNPAVFLKGNGATSNGYGVQAGPTNGQQTKGKGAEAALSSSPWARPAQGGTGSKPMKGYGQMPYGAGVGGASRGLGVPQLARNQKTGGYGAHGYKGYATQPMGGYTGGYGSAGLGHWYGNGGMKGSKQGYGAAAGVPKGPGAKNKGYRGDQAPNPHGPLQNGYGYVSGGTGKPTQPGYGNIPNGYGVKGYGGGPVSPRPGYANGAIPNGYGPKPSGYGAGTGVFKGYGVKPNGHGVRNGFGPGGNGGYGGPNRGTKPQTTKGVRAVSPNESAQTPDSGVIPNGKSTKGAGVLNGKSLKGGVLSPEQPAAAPVAPQRPTTYGPAPVAPEPTRGILIMVTQGKHHKLSSPAPQGKNYKHTPQQAASEPSPGIPQTNHLTPAPEATAELGGSSGPSPVLPQTNAGPAQGLPQVNGGSSFFKGQGAKRPKPDCGPSGVPNGQWVKIPRPGLGYPNAGNPQQPDLGQGLPAADGRAGAGSLPFGGRPVGKGVEKLNTKYGIGGLQFGGQQFSAGVNGVGQYGYGRSPYGPAGDGKSTGKYGYGGFPNSGQLLGLVPNANGNYGYGGMPYEPQQIRLGPEAKSTGSYAEVPYETLPAEPDSLETPFVNGEIPTPVIGSVGGDQYGTSENTGYINGQVQPEVVAFPAPPFLTLAYPSLPPYLSASITPDVRPGGGVEDLPDPVGTSSLPLDSEPATETLDVEQQPDDPLQQQLPRRIHIQQHLKLHFHNQAAKDGTKSDMNGFLGNSGYQG